MDRIDKWTSTATTDGLFTEGDPMVPTPATILKDAFLNMVQEELVNAVEGAGLTLDENNQSQLLQAIKLLAVPSGAVDAFGGDTAPDGWLICDGAAVSRNTYAALFAVVGTKFGAGDGTTTFNLPDLQRRMPLGKNDTTNIGDIGGAETKDLSHVHATTGHALTEAELPAHTHEVGSTTRAHWSGDVTSYPPHIAAGSGISTTSIGGDQEHAHGDTDAAGNNAENILPPYVVMNYIIKT